MYQSANNCTATAKTNCCKHVCSRRFRYYYLFASTNASFRYPDTQRYRIGGNYLMLPVNAPRCPFINHHYDGVMNFNVPPGAINYFPSRMNNIRNAPQYYSSLYCIMFPRDSFYSFETGIPRIMSVYQGDQ